MLSITITTWQIAGFGFISVFSILVILVLVLQLFALVAARNLPLPKKATASSQESSLVGANGDDIEAVATAVYLYLSAAHDEESGVLTIHQDEHSAWHAELNQHIN